MRLLFLLTAAAATIVACSEVTVSDPAEPVGEIIEEPETATKSESGQSLSYSDDWHISAGWSGEWPNSFVVVGDAVTSSGRSVMYPDAVRDIPCLLPAQAHYHPWNGERRDTDNLEFRTASLKTEITLTGDMTLDTGWSEAAKPVALTAGDTITYKSYIAEGYFVGEVNGVDYEINEGELNGVADFAPATLDDHQWVNVACAGGKGTRAWFLLSEMIVLDGVSQGEATEFGRATDLN